MFAAGKTAAVSGAGPDDKFNYVTMLLHGDGTNGAQNNTFVDSSTNNFTITRNGNTTQGSFSPYGSNWSNYFDKNGDYLTAPTPILSASGDFTIECWINATSSSSNTFVLAQFTSGSGGRTGFGLGGNTVQMFLGGSTNNGTTNISYGSWTHLAFTRSGTTFKAYVNGTLDLTVTSSVSIDQVNTNIGGDPAFSPALYFGGYISNMRVTNTVVYTGNFTPSTTPLTAVSGTRLLTCQSNRFIDNSTNNYTLTVNGDTSVQRFNPFGASTAYSTSVIGGSGYFDGSGDSLQATAGAVPAIGTSDFIISGWWYLNELKDYQILFDFRNGSNTEAVPYVYMDSTGTADYYVNGTSHTFSVTFKAKQWYYMVISRVSGTTKVFVNGTQAVSYSDSVTYVAGRLTLGFNNNGGGTYYYYSGYISDFKVVIGSGTTSGTPTTTPATATSGTQALLSMTNGAIFDNAMMNDLETVGNAQISTSVVKYGTGSMYFDETGDYITVPPSPNMSLGTGDFTIECWVRFAANPVGNGQGIYQLTNGYLNNTVRGPACGVETGSGEWTIYYGTTYTQSGVVPTTGVWYHTAFVRYSGTSKLYVNGTSVISVSDTTNYTDQYFTIGGWYDTGFLLNGYIDDLRITKGYARYTANFTSPTTAFSNTGPI